MYKYQKSIFLYGSVAVFAFFLGGGFFIQNADAANSISLGSCSGTAFSFSVSGDGADYYAVRSNSIADPTFYYTPVASPAGNCSSVYPDVCGLSAPGQVIFHNPGFYDTHSIWAHSCWYATGCSTSVTNASITCSPPAVAPTVSTSSATSIAQTSAVLNGTANANGTAGTATFMFTQSTSYPTCNGSWPWSSAIASGSSAISGTSASNYSVTLGNISPGTTYSFCAVATNSAGTSYGSVQSFTTTSPPVASCNFNGSTVPSGSSVTAYLSSSVPSGSTCTSQSRTCSNGTLSGSYQYASCSVSAAITDYKICSGGTLGSNCATGSSFSGPLGVAPISFNFAPGETKTLYSCSAGCGSGSVPVSSTWSVSGTNPSAVSLSSTTGTSVTVTAVQAGTATITSEPQ